MRTSIIKFGLSIFFTTACLVNVMSDEIVVNIEIKNHLFIPDKIEVPKGQIIKLVIHNRDQTPEEFESYELNREKIIMGKSRAIIFIGPLKEGTYPFFGEFNQKTAQGQITAK